MWVSQVGQDIRSDLTVLSYPTLPYLDQKETLFNILPVPYSGRISPCISYLLQNQVLSMDGWSDLAVISTAGNSTKTNIVLEPKFTSKTVLIYCPVWCCQCIACIELLSNTELAILVKQSNWRMPTLLVCYLSSLSTSEGSPYLLQQPSSTVQSEYVQCRVLIVLQQQ